MAIEFRFKEFARQKRPLVELPNLIEAQLSSWRWFVEEGLKELFDEISPIRDYTGKDLELSFDSYYFDEPKFDEARAKEFGLSYEAPLRVKARLLNKKTEEMKEQELFLGDFPMMTNRGTFVVNGVERVVVSQLIRSSGVFFTMEYYKGRKFFGAKVIPNRGAWLEFETDPDGVIAVKIDRKRKIPVTAVLRAFGIDSDEEIRKRFQNIDTDESVKYIEATLGRDPSKNQSEGLIEIYKRIRPGDLATVDNARQLIESMFFRPERYDLAKVGRFKMNQRLGIETSLSRQYRIFRPEDLVLIIREIIRLNNDPEAMPDDIDHLGNRRVRTIGELLQNKLRVGLTRMERIVRDRMSTLDLYTVTPAQLINARPLMAAVKEFFTSSQLAQFMDQVNPLAELEHKRRISAMGPGGLTRERAGFEVRDVHKSHYGRICPIETPEGPNIGLVGHLASFARVNELGFIETPYARVKHGKVTEEIVWMNAAEEEKYAIAQGGTRFDEKSRLILEPMVEARIKGEPGVIEREKVDFVDVSSQQFISVATSLIPFLANDDANRALMGSNMQRQAVPSVRAEAPRIGTGREYRTAVDSGHVALAEEDGRVSEVDATHITVETRGGKRKTYRLLTFLRSNQFTAISQKPIVKNDEAVKKGQVLADGVSTHGGRLALGQNLLVAFLSWGGSVFEDAIIISERVAKADRFTSIHIEDYTSDVRDTKLGPEVTTMDIPNVSEEKLKDLDEEGIVRIGAVVKEGDILVGKISPKGETELTPEERLLRAIFGEKARDVKDTSLTLPHGKRGRVVGIKIFSRDRGDKLPTGVVKEIQVEVAQLRKIQAGDKLAGRHGNKGVIAKILPEEDMPMLADGTPVDIILNPLGVASRMNLGQILETHLGWAASKLGYYAITPSLSGAHAQEIKQELQRAGLPEDGKVELFDGRTGASFSQKVTVGMIYMMKLNHLVEDKIHMRSIGPYSLITQQPLGGKAQFGGQRLGEMEVWALEGYGAAHTLQEMLTIKSDDVLGRSAAYDSIIRGEKIKSPNIPASFHVLVNELKALALSVDLVGKRVPEEERRAEEEQQAVREEKVRERVRG